LDSGHYVIEGNFTVFSTGKTTISLCINMDMYDQYINCANITCPEGVGQTVSFKMIEYIPSMSKISFIQYSEKASPYGMGTPDFSKSSPSRHSSVTISKGK
jgi:hypothetical protein